MEERGKLWLWITIWSVLGAVLLAGLYFGIKYIISPQPEIAPPEKKVSAQPEEKTWDVLLYFGSSQGDELKLTEEKREIPYHPTIEENIQELMGSLIAGPKNSDNFPVLPGNVALSGVEIKAGIAYLDFSALEVHTGSSGEMLALNSILLTLRSNLPEIKGYQILYQGKAVDSLAGHLDCSQPITGITGKVWTYKHEPLEEK
jgi:germination protein M